MEDNRGAMKTRIISALVALPLLIIFVVLGGLPLKIGVTLVALIGLFEFYKAFSGFIKPVHFIGFIAAIIYMIFIEKIIYTASLLNVVVALIYAYNTDICCADSMKAEIRWTG